MHIDVLEKAGDLAKLKENWDEVYAADPEAHYFLSWIWIASWFERPIRWFVLAAKETPDAEKYVAFFPLRLRTEFDGERGFFNTIMTGASNYAVYTGLLCRPDCEDRAVPAFADCLRGFNWTSLHLDDVYLSQERLDLFLDRFPPGNFVTGKVTRPVHRTSGGEDIDHDVYVYVRLPADFETFLAEKVGPKTRRNIRLYLRKLDGADELRVTHATEETIERDLEIFYRMWEAQWGAKSRRYADSILDSSRHMLARCFRDGSVFLPILWQGDTPVAVFVNLLDRQRRTIICFLGSRDPALKNPSPGLLLHAYNMRWGIENGFSVYDLGTGDYSYKYIFGSEEHRVERMRITTATGRNIGDRLDPRSLSVAAGRVEHFLEIGELANAQRGCRQILAADPAHAGALRLAARINAAETAPPPLHEAVTFEATFAHHRAGELAKAAAGYRALIAAEPRHFEANHQLGVVLFQQGDAKAAETQIRHALGIRPDAASAHCNYGNVLAGLGDFVRAISSYDRAVALAPDNAIAFHNRGNALRRVGRLDEALGSYERAIALRPDYEAALKGRAAILEQARTSPA
ncbi:GNAT family N-acetyltransferase [Rhizobium sp. BK251]|uniref:GNAT family N-acetyltransferase n=1 Tax=Rhizobium sp. BK251 TaxID=2512125 RepID=UPI0010F20B30|nr:GNAT family N-acetyltransferase [Rhizobium sp. BK251]TCL70437.1 CelD/BcsL family acetyltransferase involved in cellulose biosynthesis [Rhizobium sp. BK251]